jgi:hypothetical protein
MHEFILFFPPLIKYIKSVIVGISWNYAEECDQMKIFVKVGCIFRNFKVFIDSIFLSNDDISIGEDK